MTDSTMFDLPRLKRELEEFGFNRVQPKRMREALLDLRRVYLAVVKNGLTRNRDSCLKAEKAFQSAVFDLGLEKDKAKIPEYMEFQEVIDRVNLLNFPPSSRMGYYLTMHPRAA